MGIQLKGKRTAWPLEDSLAELGELARSAGARVAGTTAQRLTRHTQHYVGKGKLEELRRLADEGSYGTLICDDELAPAQQRNLENALGGAKVIDRTALILDVFARRAQTREGRLQVELAQHEYLLPRLAGQWSHLERLGGGIGTRGPGETQIETDRRLVRTRIQKLRKDLEDVRRHRSQYRARRKDQGIPVAGLVGYTNAGKSTLLNSLTRAGVPVEDRLFSTLDPVTRRLRLPSGKDMLLTDTVGFIQKLPPKVVAAFRATLEEIEEASVLLHVVDVAQPNAPDQVAVVERILRDMEIGDIPRLMVLNKVDLLDGHNGDFAPSHLQWLGVGDEEAVFTSAMEGTGLAGLLERLDALLSENERPLLPAAQLR